MNIGITGVNGFVGSFLCSDMDSFHDKLVKLSTHPTKDMIKLENGIPETISGYKYPNVLIHCGGSIGNNFSKEEHYFNNVLTTKNLLNWAEVNKVKHFIYISTGAVYGANDNWVNEETALNPENFYAESKILAENLVVNSNIENKTILRLFFPLGKSNKTNLFNRLLYKIANNETIILNNQGKPDITPFILLDFKDILIEIINKQLNGIYNLSSNQKISIVEIVDIFSLMLRKKYSYKFNDLEVKNYLGDSSKLFKIINIPKERNIKNVIKSVGEYSYEAMEK